jgi:hypothetical protein
MKKLPFLLCFLLLLAACSQTTETASPPAPSPTVPAASTSAPAAIDTPTAAAVEANDGLPVPPPGQAWERVEELSDEFDGNQLDRGKWLDKVPYWDGREPSRYAVENVSVADGFLRLKSTRLVADVAEVSNPEWDVWVSAASIASREPTARAGYYYEARFKASRLSMTSSFWLQGLYSEIDIVEQMGDPAYNPNNRFLMRMNTHYFPNGFEFDISTPLDWPMNSGAGDEFHTYGAWWRDARTVLFYHNGSLVTEVQTGGSFDELMYLFFDTEVFTSDGLPKVEALQNDALNTMLVDWVRVWRLATK